MLKRIFISLLILLPITVTAKPTLEQIHYDANMSFQEEEELGEVYLRQGIEAFKNENYSEAKDYLLKGARLNNRDAQARLGFMYWSGNGVKKDLNEAIFWLNNPAEYKDPYACRVLGLVYDEKEQYDKSFKLFKIAADQDDALAQLKIGVMYLDGQGVRQDYIKSREWFLKSAENGNGYAAYLLGSLYREGLGVRQNYTLAKEWYFKAIKSEIPDAMFDLATLYYNGEGVKQNYHLAKEFFGQACDFGDQDGCDEYKRLK